MPWTGGPGAGFSTGRPWLRLGPDVASRNVAAQQADPDSVLACYRRLLAARRTLPSLQDGTMTLLRGVDPDAVAYRRAGSGAEVLVAVAFTPSGATVRLPRPRRGGAWQPVVGTDRHPAAPTDAGRTLQLRPHEAVVLVAEPGVRRA
jgi:alpha-glucosidase